MSFLIGENILEKWTEGTQSDSPPETLRIRILLFILAETAMKDLLRKLLKNV